MPAYGDDWIDASPGGDGTFGDGTVRINEVVAYPNNDWSGPNYQGAPGTGSVTTVDEFIELYNISSAPIDLTGWTLDIVGGDTTVTELGVHGTLVLSPGSSLENLEPGAFAVLGNPEGSMSTDVYIVLRDGEGNMVDDVEIGGLAEDRDREGDGFGDGAPAADRNGFSRGTFDEALARPIGQPDTNEDQADFVPMNATPLAANMPLPVPVETTRPKILGSASGSAFKVTDLLWIELDEAVDPVSTDTTIEVRANGQEIALGFTTFEDQDRTIVINPVGRLPYDADITVIVHGGSGGVTGGVTDRAGNSLSDDFTFSVHTEAGPVEPAAVVINEVCTNPVRDWNDSSGGDDDPFSATPGSGRVSSEDEWVELLATKPGPWNLGFYTLTAYNGPNIYGPTRSSTTFTSNIATIRVVGSGTLDRLAQGDRVIIGNPQGTLREHMFLVLRDGSGGLVDTVEIGGNTADTDRGGDGVDNGAPHPGASGTSSGVLDEVVARLPDGKDTGNDVDDFVHAQATLGTAN